ncbi:MAG: LLM class flavin-dependent oxidoreductase [Actinomycetota bacterium]|nr:LLM class flavin-dependent oxidoreductase [Actinomycetota bacterium]MDA2958465.1 LLM class flavin-dependent oxidoreductase [Actinomycetota bacterium]
MEPTPRMSVGVALPQMATGLDRDRLVAWCRGIDDGPFSSVSAGERITFHNLDGFTLCSAAAALTSRVRVLVNVVVLPWHAPAMVAKELASLDVVSGGRVDVAVGVGGRQQDYAALGSPFSGRHGRLDAAVDEVRRLWSGGAAADGERVGPEPIQAGGPPILASAMGPKSLARAARWASGVSGFTLLGDAGEAARLFRATEAAWVDAGRVDQPRLVTGSFVALGHDAPRTLHDFAETYLRVFSPDLAASLASAMPLHDASRLVDLLDAIEAEGAHEFIVVPATSDPRMLDALADAVASRR